jgi:hypothetical protein
MRHRASVKLEFGVEPEKEYIQADVSVPRDDL